MSRRHIPLADQRRRTAELDSIRLQRPLTGEEAREADDLASRAYHRAWRANMVAAESRLAKRKHGGRPS